MRSVWFKQALTVDGWASDVRLTFGACIERVESGVSAAPEEERGDIAVPGLADVHSHGFQRALLAETRGPDSDNFWTWRQEMYRFLQRLTPEDVRAISAQAYCEMLESGFTRVGEFHYLHHDVDGAAYTDVAIMAKAVADAAETCGIGLTLLPVLYAHSDFGGAPPSNGQRRFVCGRDQFARLVEACGTVIAAIPGANLGVAPHSLRAVTPEELAFAASLAPNGPLHIHAAEQTLEVDGCVAWSGMRPVQWLLKHAGIDQRWSLIHATHLNAEEIVELARCGAVAGLCPITEANLGDGVFPANAFLKAGGVFGVGTDCNVSIDAACELRALEYAQRLSARARNVLALREGDSTGASLFRSACTGGARSLGVPFGIGVDAPADFVALDGAHPSMIGRDEDDALDAWIFSAGRSAVRNVWRAGVKVVEDGRHCQREAVSRAYSEAVLKLKA